jgi:hypothetical protein
MKAASTVLRLQNQPDFFIFPIIVTLVFSTHYNYLFSP